MLADNPEKRTQPISFFFSFLTFLTWNKKYCICLHDKCIKKRSYSRVISWKISECLKVNRLNIFRHTLTHTTQTESMKPTETCCWVHRSFFSDRHIPRGRTLDEAHCNIITHRSLIPWDDGFFEQQQSKVIHNFWVSLALWWPTCKRGRELYRYAQSCSEEGEREKDFLSQFSSLAAAGANGCVEYRGSLCLGILLCANAI
jgi:hypothetical protein